MKKIFVGLDEILDTRTGFIATHWAHVLAEWFQPGNEAYFKRMSDDFIWEGIGITETEYRNKWETRDVEVLKNSVVSRIPNVINTRVIEYRLGGVEAIGDAEFALIINTYPYRLDEDELAAFNDVLAEVFYSVNRIEFMHIAPHVLTPKYIKMNFDYVYMYEAKAWMDIHGEELKRMNTLQVEFYIPRLFHTKPTEEKLKDLEGYELIKDLDFFKVISASIAPKINLNFIPASDFSLVLKPAAVKDPSIQDLDSRPDPYVSYTPDNSRFDLQYPSRPEVKPSSEDPVQD